MTTTPCTKPRRLQLQFLYLDLETCTRCRGTDRNLASALDEAGELLEMIGAEIEIEKIHIASVEQAREYRFESSPSLRVNGRDIALELRESTCGSEACTDGCGDSIACRVWVHEGEEHVEPPVAMIIDAILREVYAGATVARSGTERPYELPENLGRFFADRSAAQSACCSKDEQDTCCEPEDKAECCGAASGGSCGCK